MGLFSWIWSWLGVVPARTITAEQGSYVLSGQDVTLTHTLVVVYESLYADVRYVGYGATIGTVGYNADMDVPGYRAE